MSDGYSSRIVVAAAIEVRIQTFASAKWSTFNGSSDTLLSAEKIKAYPADI